MSTRPTMTPPYAGERYDVIFARFVKELNVVTAWIEERTAALDEPPVEPKRECEACAEGRACERLQALMNAAWRHGETDE